MELSVYSSRFYEGLANTHLIIFSQKIKISEENKYSAMKDITVHLRMSCHVSSQQFENVQQ